MPAHNDEQNQDRTTPVKIKCNFPLANETMQGLVEGQLLLHPKYWDLAGSAGLGAQLPAPIISSCCWARGSHSGRCFQKLTRTVK